MTEKKFTGVVVSGRPVTTDEQIKAGIIPDPARDPNAQDEDKSKEEVNE